MKRWFNILRNDFYHVNLKDITVLEYYKFASTCYAITEYIFKQTVNKQSKEKQQLLNKSYELQLDYIYDKKFHFNNLKHMNIQNKNNETINWDEILSLDFNELSNDLFTDTNKLIANYNSRYLFSEENFYIDYYFKTYETLKKSLNSKFETYNLDNSFIYINKTHDLNSSSDDYYSTLKKYLNSKFETYNLHNSFIYINKTYDLNSSFDDYYSTLKKSLNASFDSFSKTYKSHNSTDILE